MPKDLDRHIIQRIKEGDMQAFRYMVDAYKDMSLSLVVSIIKNQVMAEDVLQEAFIKVFQKIHTFKFKASFSTWLYRIVVNTSYNELKRNRFTSQIDTLETVSEFQLNKEDLLQEENQKRFINLALGAINADEALVLRLFYLSEMSIKEIVKITGFSSSKVKVCLHRGRDNLNFQLRKLLGDELKDLL